MKKKVEFDLILGIFLFSFGLISVVYSISGMFINLNFVHLGIFILIKDLAFDVVFMLLGFLIIRKKKSKNLPHY